MGNSWGLGIAGDVNFHSVPGDLVVRPPGQNDDENWSGVSFGLLLSATLN